MDAYEQISPKRFKRVLIAVLFGFFLAIGLGILLFMVFVEGWQGYFQLLTDFAEKYVGINPPLAYFLGSGLFSMNAASPFFLDVFGAIEFGGTSADTFINNSMLPAVLTWLITGFVMGFFCKRWDDGLFSALICGIVTFVIIQVMARIAILGDQTLGVADLAYFLVVFMLLVNSSVAVFICMAGGILGGLLYSKVLFRTQAMIEEYM